MRLVSELHVEADDPLVRREVDQVGLVEHDDGTNAPRFPPRPGIGRSG